MEKKRYEIAVAGVELAILSDEREEFVKTIVENLDKEIREITVATKRTSNLDAAILCALEYYSEKVKAEKRARNLEAQISLYDANLRRFRDENIALREKLEELTNKLETAEQSAAEEPSEDKAEEPESKPDEDAEDAAEKEDAGVPAAEETPVEDARAARLRTIEALLGRSSRKNND